MPVVVVVAVVGFVVTVAEVIVPHEQGAQPRAKGVSA